MCSPHARGSSNPKGETIKSEFCACAQRTLNANPEAGSVIDDMEGLYSHASEAFREGRRRGREDFVNSAMRKLSQVSLSYEQAGDTSGFRAAEECCKTVRQLATAFDTERKTL